MRKSILILTLTLGIALQAADEVGNCDEKAFDYNGSDGSQLTTNMLLNAFGNQCGFSILIKDSAAKDRLQKPLDSVNIIQLPLNKIFDILLTENELSYEYDGKVLKISFLTTETFKINYIGTSRTGSTITDIVLSQNAMTAAQQQATGQIQGGGLGGGGASGANMQQDVHAGLVQGTMTGGQADQVSGTKIRSVDEFDFWGRIEKEIFEVAFRPGDAYQPERIFSTDEAGSSGASGGGAGGADGAAAKEYNQKGQSVIINKNAGLITVTGTVRQLERVRTYLKKLQDSMQTQVMIDVNILTVTHTNGNTVGVDWNQLFNMTNFTIPNQLATTGGGDMNPAFTIPTGQGGGFQVFASGVTLTRVLEFLNTYGKVRSVSNPKVLTLNNQPALISVGSILRYMQQSAYQMALSGNATTTTNTTYPSLFAGVLLDVTPSIQGDYIMLKINPSITKTKDVSVENQPTALREPPNLSANQLSSLVRAKDGDKIIIGGLISKSVRNMRNRVPLLGYIPIIKYAFSYDAMFEETQEMIIVITPHIVRKNDNPSLQDLGYSEATNEIIKTNDAKAQIEIYEEDD